MLKNGRAKTGEKRNFCGIKADAYPRDLIGVGHPSHIDKVPCARQVDLSNGMKVLRRDKRCIDAY